MISTSKFGTTTVGVPQHGTFWCIPASIENLLRSEGVTNITQEDLVYEYLIKNVRTGQSNTGQIVNLSTLPRSVVLDLCRDRPIPNASFQTFTRVTNGILTQEGISHKLTYIEDIKFQVDYFSHVERILGLNTPVLISAQSPAGWHITVVYQSDGTNLWSYDPDRDQHVKLAKSKYTFSNDLLYVQ